MGLAKVCAVLIAALAAAAVAAHSVSGKGAPACGATTLRYQAAKHPTLHDAAWVLAQPAARGVLVFFPSYSKTLRDRRVNRSDGLVLWTRGTRIVWSGAGLGTTLVARRLDGRGSFRTALVTTDDGPAAQLRFPSSGCWRLAVGGAVVVARVVVPPRRLGCDATPLGPQGAALARPRSSRIRGGWGPWQTSTGGALLYTHGQGGGWNMKVLWQAGKGHDLSLALAGTRLDAEGAFSQEFAMTSYDGVYPSNVDVPAAGCWLLRVRTGRLAGVLVVQAVDDRG